MSPETIDAMIAAGVTAEVLAAAWKSEIAKQDSIVQERRARDADRQRRHRESRDVTVTGDESHGKGSLEVPPPSPLPKPSKISPLNPPFEGEETEDDCELKPEHVVEAWNDMAKRNGLPLVRKLTPDRVKSLSRRIRENTIEEFTEAITAIEHSQFLRGGGKNGWRADFDFLLSPTKFNRILEGSYGHQST